MTQIHFTFYHLHLWQKLRHLHDFWPNFLERQFLTCRGYFIASHLAWTTTNCNSKGLLNNQTLHGDPTPTHPKNRLHPKASEVVPGENTSESRGGLGASTYTSTTYPSIGRQSPIQETESDTVVMTRFQWFCVMIKALWGMVLHMNISISSDTFFRESLRLCLRHPMSFSFTLRTLIAVYIGKATRTVLRR